MKRSFLLVAAGMLASSASMAQPPYPGPAPAYDRGAFWAGAPDTPRERVMFLRQRIDRGMADGSLSRGEGVRADRQIARLEDWARRQRYYDGGRLAPQQYADFQARLDGISREIRWERRGGW